MAGDLVAGEDSSRFDRDEAAVNLAPALTALRLGVDLLGDVENSRVDRERLILLLRAAAAQAGQHAAPLLQQATGEHSS